MTDFECMESGLEPERYELREAPAYHFDLDRRGFLRAMGGGIAVVFLLDRAGAQEPNRQRARGTGGRSAPGDVGSWLRIDEQGRITVFTGKAEVGQNIRTSLTQAVAEELRCSPESIEMVMADTKLTPFDMGTFGSRTTPDMGRQLHRVAAAARELLVDLAAEHWKVDRGTITVEGGTVVHSPSRRALDFSILTKGQVLTKTVSDDAHTTPAEHWKVGGHSLAKVKGRDFVTGAHHYASNVALPGMLHGKVLRPPAFGSTLTKVDLGPAQAQAGVVVVRDGDFVGVAAPDEHTASKALRLLQAEWKATPQVSARELFDHLKASSAPPQGRRGNANPPAGAEREPRAGELRLEQDYTIAYIAHAPLEPRAAVAQWEGDSVTVWTGTQRPFGVRGELAQAFGISEDRVRVIVPDTGSGYGGKHTGEAAIEAARLAKAAHKPVKLVWTRAEEMTWAYFRPAGLIEVKSSVNKDGRLASWQFTNYNSGASGLRSPYDVANQQVAHQPARSPLRQGSYRALASTANHFARESHMDELAHALGLDPLEFRLKNLSDGRLRDVLKAAAESFGWGKRPDSRRGFGLACGAEKGGFLATCAEVEVEANTGRARVVRALSAFECGAIVNPDQLKNQVEGALVMGLGGALFEAIDFEEGHIVNGRFSRYRVPRFSDVPQIEIVLLDRTDLPSAGAGEAPIVGIAPAVANAIFSATGKRLRSMPLTPKGVVA